MKKVKEIIKNWLLRDEIKRINTLENVAFSNAANIGHLRDIVRYLNECLERMDDIN